MGWADALSGMGAGFSGQGPQWQIANTDRQKALAALDEKRKQAMLEDFRNTLLDLKGGDIGSASQRLQDRLGAISKLGGDPYHTALINRYIQEGKIDEATQALQELDDRAVQAGALPSMADKKLGMTGGQVVYQGANGPYAKPIEGLDMEALKSTSGGGDPATVREYLFYNSLSKEDQKRFLEMKRAQQLVDLGGGLKGSVIGQEALPVTSGGQTPEQARTEFAGAESTLEGAKAKEKALGTGAAEESTSAYQAAQNVRKGLKNYDRAINAIDRGANSGKLASMFPSIKGTTIELENIRSSLGLDVVAVSKFGALSEGELGLALAVAIPDLPPDQLKVWLKDKKAAQEKLANYYEEVSIYLGKPGNTLPKYLEEQKASREDSNVVDWSEL